MNTIETQMKSTNPKRVNTNVSRKILRYCFILLGLTCLNIGSVAQMLKVSSNGRYLEKEDGTAFFYMGDTAWELFHRLDRDEADRYLQNRAAKGFNVIQAVVLPQIGNLNEPNAYGHLPLLDQDPTKPVEAYFEHVDYIVEKANELGLVIGMLPSWGSYWSMSNPERVIFDSENALSYGKFLGERYRSSSIIWILGGDSNINTEEEREIIEAMAKGLKEGDGGAHLITFHPRGPGLSSDYFHSAPWLDFNMFQSSHAAHDHDNGLFAAHDYQLEPAKPTLDGEPRYERIPVGFYFKNSNFNDRFDDYDVRQAAYWSVLSGACGHTYGHNNIWQMYAEKHSPVILAEAPWHESLDHPGAFQMGILKDLFTSRSFYLLEPNQEMIVDGPDRGGAKVKGALANDGSIAIIYSPRGEPFSIDKSYLKEGKIREVWFNPRYGTEYQIHATMTQGIQTYKPPTSGRGNDWILILEE